MRAPPETWPDKEFAEELCTRLFGSSLVYRTYPENISRLRGAASSPESDLHTLSQLVAYFPKEILDNFALPLLRLEMGHPELSRVNFYLTRYLLGCEYWALSKKQAKLFMIGWLCQQEYTSSASPDVVKLAAKKTDNIDPFYDLLNHICHRSNWLKAQQSLARLLEDWKNRKQITIKGAL